VGVIAAKLAEFTHGDGGGEGCEGFASRLGADGTPCGLARFGAFFFFFFF